MLFYPWIAGKTGNNLSLSITSRLLPPLLHLGGGPHGWVRVGFDSGFVELHHLLSTDQVTVPVIDRELLCLWKGDGCGIIRHTRLEWYMIIGAGKTVPGEGAQRDTK